MIGYSPSTCSRCRKNKLRKHLGQYRYVDEQGRAWSRRVCPDCREKRKSLHVVEQDKTCTVCQKSFHTKIPEQIRCSKPCRDLYYKHAYKRKTIPKETKTYSCLNCSIEIKSKTERKFCNRPCYDSWLLKQPKKDNGYNKQYVTKSCLSCKQEFTTSRPLRGKYCSEKCQRRERKKRNKPKWKLYKRLKKKQLKVVMPKWADSKQMLDIYSKCPKGHHVDHIIPLNHPDVSGLHVQNNLQYLPAKDNEIKSNKFDGTYENNSWKLKKR